MHMKQFRTTHDGRIRMINYDVRAELNDETCREVK